MDEQARQTRPYGQLLAARGDRDRTRLERCWARVRRLWSDRDGHERDDDQRRVPAAAQKQSSKRRRRLVPAPVEDIHIVIPAVVVLGVVDVLLIVGVING